MRKSISVLLICFFLFGLVFPVHAAIPNLITYQGILKDSAGNYLTGTYSMTFRIYGVSTGGNVLWNETQSSVSVSSGKFSAQLGSVTPIALTFGQDYWLSLQVGTDAEMTPRQKLTSVGYAYMAEDVTGGKLTSSQHVQDTHMGIEGVVSAHTNIAKTNFKLDAHTMASANNMGDMIVDTFNDATGIDASQSTSHLYRGNPNYDVVVDRDSSTVLLLHTNGTDGSTSFPDNGFSSHLVTANGNAQVDTAQSKFGGAGGLFDGSGDSLTVPDHADWDFGTGDFTIDFWVRFNSASGGQYFFHRRDNQEIIVLDLNDVTAGHLTLALMGSYTDLGAWSPTVGTWYHFALARSGSSVKFYINGSQFGSTITNTSNISATTAFHIGAWQGWYGAINGWIDEFRVSKGVARWTANFTPPAQEYASAQGPATVVSVSFSESVAPKETMVIPDETPGTGSLTYYVSRNNGTTWTQCAKETAVSLASQPSGTQVRWKAVISGDAELNAIALALT